MSLLRRVSVIAWVLLGLAQNASATSMLSSDLPTLSQSSDEVLRGKVRRVESRWNGDHTRIMTDVEIEVLESFKGAQTQTVLVTQPGGSVNGFSQMVSGLAEFEPGEEVVVFLRRYGRKGFHVSGLAQGKFTVERSADGKEVMAVPASTGEALLLDPVTHQPTTSSLRSLSLTELRTAVKRAAAQKDQGQNR